MATKPKRPKEYRMVVIGEPGVGKTCTRYMYTQGYFIETYDPTLTDDGYRKQVTMGRETCLVELLEANLYDCPQALLEQWIKSVDAALLVYSITDRRSFMEVRNYWNEVRRVEREMREEKKANRLAEMGEDGTKEEEGKEEEDDEDDIPILLMGNKCDAEQDRLVSKQEGEDLARELGCPFYEASAKENIKIDKVFRKLLKRISEQQLWQKMLRIRNEEREQAKRDKEEREKAKRDKEEKAESGGCWKAMNCAIM